jgi:hypothetical protein
MPKKLSVPRVTESVFLLLFWSDVFSGKLGVRETTPNEGFTAFPDGEIAHHVTCLREILCNRELSLAL